MSFSVIIPSKTITNLVPCIQAVFRHEPKLERIVVVDDGIDWTEEATAELEGITCIPGEKPFVFSRNVNIGIRHTLPKIETTCSGDLRPTFMDGQAEEGVVVLNDDALLESRGGFSLLERASEEHPEFGLIGVTTNITGQPFQQPRGIGLREIATFAFVGVFIPAHTLRTVGLMDERFNADYGCEDADYIESVTRAGFKIGVHDGCYVDHGSLTSTFRGDPKAPKSFKQNLGLLMQKWGGRLVSQPTLR
jgi:glycosyltransferase involved in cell wall biosynthesis